MQTKDQIFKEILDLMNEAYADDIFAIHTLICNQVPCNATLAEHPTIQVNVNRTTDGYYVGLLGIVNGITERLTNKKIAASFDDKTYKFLGFVEYKG